MIYTLPTALKISLRPVVVYQGGYYLLFKKTGRMAHDKNKILLKRFGILA